MTVIELLREFFDFALTAAKPSEIFASNFSPSRYSTTSFPIFDRYLSRNWKISLGNEKKLDSAAGNTVFAVLETLNRN